MPVIPALEKERQGYQEFQASLNSRLASATLRPCFAKLHVLNSVSIAKRTPIATSEDPRHSESIFSARLSLSSPGLSGALAVTYDLPRSVVLQLSVHLYMCLICSL